MSLRLEEIAKTTSISTAHDEAAACLRHTEQLLDGIASLMSVVRSHRRDARDVDIGDLVTAHARLFEPALRSSRRHITVEVAGDTSVSCVEGAIGEAVNVVIDNACTHGQGDVTVDVEAIDVGVRIRVADEGRTTPPAPAEQLPGRGLALARSLLRVDGGRLHQLNTAHTTYEILLTRSEAGA